MKKLSVLIAEEDPMLRSMYLDYTRKVPGFDIIGMVDSGEDLFISLKREAPDLVLMDLFLEGFDALEGLRYTRCAYSRTDIILMSCGKPPRVVSDALRMGAFEYLIKPFTFDRFYQALMVFRGYQLALRSRREPWNQEDLDQLIAARRRALVRHEEPKGFQQKLLVAVEELVQGACCPVTAVQVGSILSVSRTTARRYLEYLVESGRLRLLYDYQKVGRPVKRYFRMCCCESSRQN